MGLPSRASVSRPRRVLLIERGDNCLRVRLLAAGDTTMLLVAERAHEMCSGDIAALSTSNESFASSALRHLLQPPRWPSRSRRSFSAPSSA